MNKWVIVYTKLGVIHIHKTRFDHISDALMAAQELRRDKVADWTRVQISQR